MARVIKPVVQQPAKAEVLLEHPVSDHKEVKKMRQLMINQNRKTIELEVKEKENQTLTGILAQILSGILAKTFPRNVDIEDKYGEEKADKVNKEEKEATIMEQHKCLDQLEDEKRFLLDKMERQKIERDKLKKKHV